MPPRFLRPCFLSPHSFPLHSFQSREKDASPFASIPRFQHSSSHVVTPFPSPLPAAFSVRASQAAASTAPWRTSSTPLSPSTTRTSPPPATSLDLWDQALLAVAAFTPDARQTFTSMLVHYGCVVPSPMDPHTRRPNPQLHSRQ